MTRRNGLPLRVYLRNGRYFYVDLPGKWNPLTREREGLPAMYRALAAHTDREVHSDAMPAIAARWFESKKEAGDWGDGMVENMTPIVSEIGRRLCDYSARDMTTPIAATFLKPHLARGRAYNMRRSVLRQVLSFAALEGLRDGHNPIDDIPQRKTKQRTRIVTDAEIAAIKAAMMQAARGGEAHCLMVDLAMMTGQRIGDVLRMRWDQVSDAGITVKQGKTGAQVLIQWSKPLKTAVDACAIGRDREGFLLVKSTGAAYRYAGVRSAWDRACIKAGVEDLNIHDMRGRAGADRADEAGIEAAQFLLGHDRIGMTEDYVRGKRLRKAQAPGGVQEKAGKPRES